MHGNIPKGFIDGIEGFQPVRTAHLVSWIRPEILAKCEASMSHVWLRIEVEIVYDEICLFTGGQDASGL